jgi:hypothetical protein
MAENKEKTMEEKMLEALEQVKNELATVKEENAAMKEKLQEAEKKAKEAAETAKEAKGESKLTEAQKRTKLERDMHAAMQKAKEDTVMVKIPKTETEREDVFVCVNGCAYLIQRGQEVEVPKFVAEVLKNSEEQREAAYELMEKMEDKNKDE